MNTADRILDVVQYMIQTRGYNAFSYQDVANEIGIKKASIYYHYPKKADLVRVVVERYRQGVLDLQKQLDADEKSSYSQKLTVYIGPFLSVSETENIVCLCGVLGGEFITLPKEVQEQVTLFFNEHEKWLTKLFTQGRAAGEFHFKKNPREMARLFFSSLEGAILVVRATGDSKYFNQVVSALKDTLHKDE